MTRPMETSSAAGVTFPNDAAAIENMRRALGLRASLRHLERLRGTFGPETPRVQRLAVLVPLAFLLYRSGRHEDALAIWDDLGRDRREQANDQRDAPGDVASRCTGLVLALLDFETEDFFRAADRTALAATAGAVLDALAALEPCEDTRSDMPRQAGPSQSDVHPASDLAPAVPQLREPFIFLRLLSRLATARRLAGPEGKATFTPRLSQLCRRLVLLGWMVGPSGAYVAACLNSVSTHLFRQQQLVLSLGFCRLALQQRRANLGERHLLYGVSCANLASTHLELGHFEAAERLLLKAIAITPIFHHPWYWFGRLHAARNRPGDRQREIRIWRRYLGLNPTFPDRIEEAQQRLAGVSLLIGSSRPRTD